MRPAIIIEQEQYDTLLKDISEVKSYVHEIKRLLTDGKHLESSDEPRRLFGEEIRKKLGWSLSSWSKSQYKSKLILNGNLIIHRDNANRRRYWAFEKDILEWKYKYQPEF